MKILLVTGILLVLVSPLRAETYSWMDDSGTFHFTEDYSRIPKKYRKKVKWRDDMPAGDSKTPASATSGKKDAKGAEASPRLYGGRTEEGWKSELNTQERELTRLEGILEHLKKQYNAKYAVSRAQANELAKEYNETGEIYKQKYAAYNEVVEAARKAGLTINIKK